MQSSLSTSAQTSLRPLLTWALLLILIGVFLGVALDRAAFASSASRSENVGESVVDTVCCFVANSNDHAERGAVAATEAESEEPNRWRAVRSSSPVQPSEPRHDPSSVAPTLVVNLTTIVIASWYGPGFYGNRTACGQLFNPTIQGVAHRTLPCGTLVTLSYQGRTVTVPVIDRGPFIFGRTFDLSYATKLALGCSDLCSVEVR